MRRSPFVALVAALTLLLAPAAAHAGPGADYLAAVRTAGTTVVADPDTGRLVVTVDDTVGADTVAVLRSAAARAGALVRHEPGRLSTLIAAGEGIYTGTSRCSLGANVRSGSTWYFISAGHCLSTAPVWYTSNSRTTVIGSRAGVSFPNNDYGIVRYTNTLLAHPPAVYLHPGLLYLNGPGTASVGLAVCRSGATTGVRCGTVTGLNATVNYAQGSVTGLIRTNICAEPGDSGGPLYVAATGRLLGILSGGSGNCTSGGTTFYQPIGEILAAYGVTFP